jgi:2'-5' RNA ligase
VARDRTSRPEARALRLFVAVEIPTEMKAIVDTEMERWRRDFPQARWAPVDNWHVTVKFLGQVYPRLQDWVQDQIAGVASRTSAFSTGVTGVGAFPSNRRARVVWVGLDDRAGRMAELALALDAALASEFRPETRPFTAHLTVARSDPPLSLPEGFGEMIVETEGFTVEQVVLFRSHLRRPAPIYEPIRSFPFEG